MILPCSLYLTEVYTNTTLKCFCLLSQNAQGQQPLWVSVKALPENSSTRKCCYNKEPYIGTSKKRWRLYLWASNWPFPLPFQPAENSRGINWKALKMKFSGELHCLHKQHSGETSQLSKLGHTDSLFSAVIKFCAMQIKTAIMLIFLFITL